MTWRGIVRLLAALGYASAVVWILEGEILPHMAGGAIATGLLLFGVSRLAGPASIASDGLAAGSVFPSVGLSRLTGVLICVSILALGVLGLLFFKNASVLVYLIAGALWLLLLLAGVWRLYHSAQPRPLLPRADARSAVLLVLPGIASVLAGLVLVITGVVFYGEYSWRCRLGCGWTGMFSILSAFVIVLNGVVLMIFGDWRLHWRGFRS